MTFAVSCIKIVVFTAFLGQTFAFTSFIIKIFVACTFLFFRLDAMALTVVIKEFLSFRAICWQTSASAVFIKPILVFFALLNLAFALARINIPCVILTRYLCAVFRLADAFAVELIPDHVVWSAIENLNWLKSVSLIALTTAIIVVKVVVLFT